jgi:hypothetical protein
MIKPERNEVIWVLGTYNFVFMVVKMVKKKEY